MLFDLTIIGFGVIGVETLHGLKKNFQKNKNKKILKIAVIEKKLDNIPGGVAYSKLNSKFGFFNNPLRLSHPDFIKWFNLFENKKKILDFATKNHSYNLSIWANNYEYILHTKYKDYKEIYLPRLIYSFFLKDKILDFLKHKNKLNILIKFYKGDVCKINFDNCYHIIPSGSFINFSIKNNNDKFEKKENDKKINFIKSNKIVIGIGVTPPKKINEITIQNNNNYIWDFYTSGGTNNLLNKIYKIKKIKNKINITFIGNKAGLLETMQEIEKLIKEKKIDISITCISKNSLTLQKAERSIKFNSFKFKFLIKKNIKKIIYANQIYKLLIKEFKVAKIEGFNKYDVWTNVLSNKILSTCYNQLNNKEKENYNLHIFPLIRNITRYTYPHTVMAKNRLEKLNKIKSLKDKVESIYKYKDKIIVKTKKNNLIKSDIVINVSGPVAISDINKEIKFVKSLKKITKKFTERGFTPNNKFILERGLYLPGTLSHNFNPGRETIIKAITKNSHKVSKDICEN